MPSASSVPAARVRSARRFTAAAASSVLPLRAAASTSSGSDHAETISSSRSLARWAGSSAAACWPSPLCSSARAYSPKVRTTPSARSIAATSLASIIGRPCASSPRHPACRTRPKTIGDVPVASAISSASSSSAAAAASSPSKHRTSESRLSASGSTASAPVSRAIWTLTQGERVPCVVVEQVRSDAPGDPWPADVLIGPATLVAHGDQRLLERARAGGVAVGEADREPVEQQIDGVRTARAGRRIARGPRHGRHASAEAAGDACCPYRLEVGLGAQGRDRALRAARPHRAAAAPRRPRV